MMTSRAMMINLVMNMIDFIWLLYFIKAIARNCTSYIGFHQYEFEAFIKAGIFHNGTYTP